MTRCATCRRWIWPWSHYGFLETTKGKAYRWHVTCGQPL